MNKKPTLSMFPSVEESKAFFNEQETVSKIMKANKAPIELLVWASKYSIKK